MSDRAGASAEVGTGSVDPGGKRRIVIVGCSGSGKSTLARELGALLGLPVAHLDALLWKPGWVMTPRDGQKALVREWAQRDRWIIDGNYASTLPVSLERADTVIYLDFPRWLCLVRVFRRFWRYRGGSRPDMAQGCPEKIDAEFLRWIWNFRRDVRPKVLEIIGANKSGLDAHFFTRPSEVARFVKTLKATGR